MCNFYEGNYNDDKKTKGQVVSMKNTLITTNRKYYHF